MGPRNRREARRDRLALVSRIAFGKYWYDHMRGVLTGQPDDRQLCRDFRGIILTLSYHYLWSFTLLHNQYLVSRSARTTPLKVTCSPLQQLSSFRGWTRRLKPWWLSISHGTILTEAVA